jgi:uncharacterized damage-inducible protein DinB
MRGNFCTMSPMTLDEERYPIGKFHRPTSSMHGIRAAHIDTLRVLPDRLLTAVSGLTEQQLDTPYREGGWSVRQLVHHIADSHANSYIRFKLALTEENPTIKTYDEAAWANLHDSRRLPIDISLNMIAALHSRWVALLEAMTDEEFQRGYVHPESGPQNLTQALALYDWHSRHHTAHITRLRERNGW